MKLEFQEISQTLGEFYPDGDLRGEAHRAFVHRFLSPYMHANPRAFFAKFHGLGDNRPAGDPVRAIQSIWGLFEERAGLVPPESSRPGIILFRRVTDLTAEALRLENFPAVLVSLPPPEVPLACSHALAVLLHPGATFADWPSDARARFFTLERIDEEDDGDGFACEWARDGSHTNHGGLRLTDRVGFMALAAARVRAGEPQHREPETPPPPAIPSRKPWWKFW